MHLYSRTFKYSTYVLYTALLKVMLIQSIFELNARNLHVMSCACQRQAALPDSAGL
jgi:hypothetical protein